MLIKTGNNKENCNQPKGKGAILQPESNIVLINDSMHRLTLKLTDLKKGNRKVWLQLFSMASISGTPRSTFLNV